MESTVPTTQEAQFRCELEAAAEQLGLPLTANQRDQLLAFLALLRKWNAAYNLTAIRDAHEQLVLHLFDCLAIMPVLNARLAGGASVLDVGSGGGLPGAVIAICRSDVQVHSVDAVGKKAAFVRQVRSGLGLENLQGHHARVEALRAGHDLPAVDTIVSRAFAALPAMIALTAHLLAPRGVWMAMKGALPDAEIDELPVGIRVLETLELRVPQLDAQRHLILLGPALA